MKIRVATPEDADGVNAVYNPYILESPSTFETDPWDQTKRMAWIKSLAADRRYPALVAETEAGICGFANAAPFDPRPAYGTSVKTSVFVDPARHGQGAATLLYRALFKEISAADVHRAYGLVVAPNPASVALHRAFGFAHISTLDEVGRKFGRYYSVMWFEKRL